MKFRTCLGQSRQCFDARCSQPADYELRGFYMCLKHYLEALEHGAHLGSEVNPNVVEPEAA